MNHQELMLKVGAAPKTIHLVRLSDVLEILKAIAKQSPQLALEMARLIHGILNQGSNGYWAYQVVSAIGEGDYGFAFVGVGAVLGLANESVYIYHDRKELATYKKWYNLINITGDELATVATIINYIQGPLPQTLLASILADIVMVAATVARVSWIHNKPRLESKENTSRLAKVIRSNPFKIIAGALESGVDGAYGASWSYYVYDLANSFSYPLPFDAQDVRLQISLGFLYAGLNLMARGNPSHRKLKILLYYISWFTLLVNSLYAASNSFYIVTEIVMDIMVAVLKTYNTTNAQENHALMGAGAAAAISLLFFAVEGGKALAIRGREIMQPTGTVEEVVSSTQASAATPSSLENGEAAALETTPLLQSSESRPITRVKENYYLKRFMQLLSPSSSSQGVAPVNSGSQEEASALSVSLH